MTEPLTDFSTSRQSLDPDPSAMRALGYQLVDKLVSHLSTLREQPVARRGTLADFSSLVDESLPELPGDHADCLEFFLNIFCLT